VRPAHRKTDWCQVWHQGYACLGVILGNKKIAAAQNEPE
jgi:hypothetical protein